MLVIQNTSGQKINLGFVRQGITLLPGETTEIENIVVEDPSFQTMENDGDITILSYSTDPTRLQVRQEIKPVLDSLDTRVTTLESGAGGKSESFGFSYWSVPSDVSGVMGLDAGFGSKYVMHTAGFLIRASMIITIPRTAGSITVKPQKNGSPMGANDLDMTINGTNPEKVTNDAPANTAGLDLAVGDELSVSINITGFSPVGAHVYASFLIGY